MKKRISRMTVIALVVVLFCTSVSFAGEYCTQIKGSAAETQSFVVKTGKKLLTTDYVKFTQKKGTLKHTKGLTNANMANMHIHQCMDTTMFLITIIKQKRQKKRPLKVRPLNCL